ncbi:Protein kinase-like domain [Pseudocohnilembus persalinus]|uniref:Protein kinase-like domain n=1 Tax=Pseudocohnilembus persalinus TaxID=266149 RepID=A0A0V0QCF8_PSEPJ|nr:Protein kinase-like domain [Pseudocohnilembus persalinus]|eukprot:KRW99909.1 Protein kinase-like domain [Pseudocohnilembus persalinus]
MTSRHDYGNQNMYNQQEGCFETAKYIEEKTKTGNTKKYLKGKFLGKGGFAKCYEFTVCDTNKVVASKIIPKASLTKQRAKSKLMSEIKIHRSLNQANIVGFMHFFEDSENVYILLELCTNQTMNELIRRRKRLTELEVQCYMLQILNSVKYLHQHRVIHRDLKLGNLFLSEKMEIKLGDFGLATKLDHEGERKRTICGTPNYIAPEILEGSKRGHSYEVDVWSIGVIMYTLLIGKPPFETNDVKTTYKRIKQNDYSFPQNVVISSRAKDIITKILQTDPQKRPTIDQILGHQFFNNGGTIPKVLPVSTLACPPSASYVRQFLPQNNNFNCKEIMGNNSPRKMESTAPLNPSSALLREKKDFMNTDRNSQGLNYNRNNFNNYEFSKERQMIQSGGGQMKHMQTQENLNSVRNSLDKYNFKMGKTQTEVNLKTNNQFAFSSNTNTNNNNVGTIINGVCPPSSDLWVKKWVDYSSKYGLGYLLSTGQAGAFFNDSTKMILDKDGKKFEYIERKGQEREDNVTTHLLSDYPKELQKKITLLFHFKNYLEGEKEKENGIDGYKDQQVQITNGTATMEGISRSCKQSKNIYVKKWMKTKHAIMFRLSNKVVQVVFQDQTEIILSSELKIVTYVNKVHERLTFPLANALESSNQEMSKRLKYTKDILTHMLQNQGTSTNTNNNIVKKQSSQNEKQNTNLNNNSNNNYQERAPLQENKMILSQQRQNKHISNNGTQEKPIYFASKYTPSVESKTQYATNPIYGSLGKTLKTNNYQDENEILQQQQMTNRIQKQSSTNGFNLTGSAMNNQKYGLDNIQLLKSQSTIGRMSLLNNQQQQQNNNNNFMSNNNSQRKTEMI